MSKPIWTFTSDSKGYMLFKDGVPQGGAGTMGSETHLANGKRRPWQHRRADVKMFHDTAKRQCDAKNSEAAGQ